MQVASSGRDAARKIIETDLEQAAMVLTTLVASTTYGWIEGYAIETPRYEATQIWWILGHFSTYSLAMAILFACVTGGFGLLKARSMFVQGKRYFLFTFAGNFPFSWLVEDFAFFWFYPEWRLTDTAWTNWGFGGFWLLDPWRSGVKIWIPNWYWMVLAFWAVMMFWAHRCTIYDNLIKDEIAREVLPATIHIPSEAKRPEPPKPVQPPPVIPEAKPEPPIEQPQTIEDAPPPAPPVVSEPKPRARSPEAEEALARLRKKWVRSNASGTSGAS